jgi:hypothetical protein
VAEGEAFWATVSSLSESFRASAPEGTSAVIEVETFDGQTFVPLVVQRYPPWVIFETGDPEDPEDLDAREVLLVREEDVRRVRMRRTSGEKGFGFSVGQVIPE